MNNEIKILKEEKYFNHINGYMFKVTLTMPLIQWKKNKKSFVNIEDKVKILEESSYRSKPEVNNPNDMVKVILDATSDFWLVYSKSINEETEKLNDTNKKELIIMIGVQGSGKSMYVDKHFKNKYQIICFDDIRRAFGDIFNHRTEPLITSIGTIMFRAFMERGLSIIVDNLNVNKFLIEKYRELCNEYGYILKAIVMNIPIELCKKKIGINKITEEVMDKTIKNFNELLESGVIEKECDSVTYVNSWEY